jgi:hypothetical protein
MSRGPAEMALMADTPVPPSVADAPELAAAAQKATPVPRPPGSARSAASSRASVRSAASYRRLHNRAAADKMAELISMKAQLDASSTGRRLGPKAKKKLTSLASREASSLVSSGAVQLEQLPRSVRPGFLTTVHPPTPTFHPPKCVSPRLLRHPRPRPHYEMGPAHVEI